MVNTRRTKYISNVCSKISGACSIVHREDGCGAADGSGSSEQFSDLLRRRDHLVGVGCVDGGEVSSDDKCRVSVLKDEELLRDTLGGRGNVMEVR